MSTSYQQYADRHKEEIEATGSLIERIGEAVAGRALNRADSTTIFGPETTQGERTVIPVGKVSLRYGFGGGSGIGIGEDVGSEGVGGGGGGGGGGMVNVKPVGYIEVTPDQSRFVPIADSSTIAVRAVTIWGIVGLFAVIGLFRYLRARQDRAG
jgi:uncharacterized spore protein YtfJ